MTWWSARISSTADVVVIGGGLIGTSIGWRLRQAGLDVAMVVGELLLTRRACRQYEPLLAPNDSLRPAGRGGPELR